MANIPFSIYDFFAHLSSGVILLAALTRVVRPALLDGLNPLSPRGVVILILAYITGHIIAHLASFILEHKIVKALLGKPETVLFGRSRQSARFLAPQYCRPLPAEIQAKIMKRAEAEGFTESSEALFLHARWTVARDAAVNSRLTDFLNLYGFSRNMSLTFVLVLVLFALSAPVIVIHNKLVVLAVIAFVACIMFYRFLKYYRLYALEVFIAYSEGSQCH